MAFSPAALSMLLQARQNPRAMLAQVMAEMADDDPQLAMVGQYLASQPVDEEEAEIEEELQPALSEDDTHSGAQAAELQSMREELESIQLQLLDQNEWVQDAADRNAELAAALGACPQCWGEDDGCSTCGGTGVPGAFPLDRSSFNYYVVPVLRRLRLTQGRRPPPSDGAGPA